MPSCPYRSPVRFARLTSPALVLVVAVVACESSRPDPSSPRYLEAVAAFFRGVAAIQVGESGLAEASFQRVVELLPREPAGWADLGLVALQRRELDEAAARLAEARELAPDHSRIQLLSALIEMDRGRVDTATAYLRRAADLDPRNLPALYLLAQQLTAEARPDAAREARGLIDRILGEDPGNLVALVERARLAAGSDDRAALEETLARIRDRAESLSVPVDEGLGTVRTAADAGDFREAATQLAFVQSELQPSSGYQADEQAVLTSPSRLDLLLTAFVSLPTPTAQSAPADTGLTFEAESLTVAERGTVAWVQAAWLSETTPLALLGPGTAGDDGTLWMSPQLDQFESYAIPPAADDEAPSPAAIATLDFDYDFRVDLAAAGRSGLRLLRQDDDGSFTDVTDRAIPPAAARGSYAGVWAADVDMEGDLDLILGRIDGGPLLLQNRGDGTFAASAEFDDGLTRIRRFVWADLDADGDPDAGLLDASGHLHVFLNDRDRVPRFRPLDLPDTLAPIQAVAAADWNRDATLDLVALDTTGRLVRLSRVDGGWDTEDLASWPGYTPGDVSAAGLLIADLDNNGALDVVASTADRSQAWVATSVGLVPLAPLDARITAVADISGDGRLDLLGVGAGRGGAGEPRLFTNEGTLDYFSTTILATAAQATGDRRVNPFGIGGEIEVRAGLLYQKQVIDRPSLHFGLGQHPQVDVARIIWPNGSVQAEFNLAATSETILTRQRLKGSCPWVFAFDGREMQFVTDFIWRSALGLRINAQGDATVIHGEDWIRIRGDQLAPRDGFYDLRITAELWETHFFDHISLLVVDHPDTTDVFVDERFTQPAPAPTVFSMKPLQPVASARDESGRDVTAVIAALDGRYVDTFELGPYQGIAREHYVEVMLGEDPPSDGPLWLVASGWVYPTDASINVAVSQGDHPAPHGLALDVADGHGGWLTVNSDLGFPAGKTKTILVDLGQVFPPGAPRTLRLRTNMEIYWDRLAWAVGLPDASIDTVRVLPDTAELRYRGFSEVSDVARSTPEIPHYRHIAGAAPEWRDLVGFYTRFGDVRELTEAVDDRYTIMNAGDELALRFPAPPPPPAGWTRDFVLIGDGWVKDGDYNTGFSTTVRPLPFHGMTDYTNAPGRLEDDPAYRLHPDDWKTYHTRYVTPRAFHRALVSDPN